jgi:hypothetical protein
MGGMARFRDPITQSLNFRDQLIVASQLTRHPRPDPPARIRVSRKVAVEKLELETLSCRPIPTGRLVVGSQHNRPARLARIAPPENAESIAFCSHLGALDTVDISRKLCRGQPVSFHRRRPTVPKAGWPAAHPSRLAGLAQAIESCAAWHLTVQPITEPSAADHEVLALFLGLKSEDATGARISLASECIHDATFRSGMRANCIMTRTHHR